MQVGFIGAGQMATALAAGIAESDSKPELLIFDPNPSALTAFESSLSGVAIRRCQGNQQVVSESDYIIIAVKPQMIDAALGGLGSDSAKQKTFISVVAGTTISMLQRLLANHHIIRSMPNTPCLIKAGAIAVCRAADVPDEDFQIARQLLTSVGTVVEVAEDQMDAVTGLSGSGPAYVYTFVEALVDAGVMAGLPRQIAAQLATQTVLGAARMVVEKEMHPANLRDQVTSPGGTTIHGLAELEKSGFRSGIMLAVKAATKRANELGQIGTQNE